MAFFGKKKVEKKAELLKNETLVAIAMALKLEELYNDYPAKMTISNEGDSAWAQGARVHNAGLRERLSLRKW